MLGGVHNLNLSHCVNVSTHFEFIWLLLRCHDRVHTLNLSDCLGVRNVSMLGGVHMSVGCVATPVRCIVVFGDAHAGVRRMALCSLTG
jgi:hypothetical protein